MTSASRAVRVMRANVAIADLAWVRFAYPIVAVAAVAALAAGPTVTTRPVAYTTSSIPATDTTATIALRALADRTRRDAGLEPLLPRAGYASAATRIAVELVNGQGVTYPNDQAPISYLSGTASADSYDSAVDSAMSYVVAVAHDVLAYPLHTDGGWSVVTKMSGGMVRWGVALVVGWPEPNVGATHGCSTSGYCWANGGLNPHLPWTRNVVKVWVSTSRLPSAGTSLVRTAIANVNKVSGFAADLRYAGTTADTAPTAAHRFLVVWGACGSSSALACTLTGTQGTYDLIYQARTTVSAARYASNPSTSWWVGTLMHELGHAVGLDHYNSAYGGSYQLMRWAGGPNVLRSGDANGLRRVAPAGHISASLRWDYGDLVVTTSSTGLGGIRSITTQCTDAYGTYRTVRAVSGTYDIRPYARTVGAFWAPDGATRHCRAVVKSKTGSYVTPAVSIVG